MLVLVGGTSRRTTNHQSKALASGFPKAKQRVTRWPWVAKTSDRLLGPHAAITDDRDRLGARLFAGLMLVHLALVAALLLTTNLVWHHATGQTIWNDLDAWAVLAGAAVIVVAFALLRAGRYRPALWLYIGSTIAVPLIAPFVPDVNAEVGLVATAIIPVLLASIVFSYRIVFAVLLVVVTGPAIRLLLADMPFRQKGTGFALLVVVAVTGSLLLVFRRHWAVLERKRLEQIRNTEEKYRRLFDTITDGIIVTNRETTILEVNEALCRQLGYRREELVGRSALDISARTTGDVEAARRMLLDVGHAVYETSHRRKDGSTMPVELALTLAEFGGETAILAVVRDLSERRRMEAEKRRLEDQLQHTGKMESIGQLAGGIAHDFNNLLTAILGNAEMALDDLPADAPPVAPLEQILRAANSAAALTGQLLAFSRKQIIAPRQTDLNELIAHTQKMLARLIGEDVALTTLPGADLWLVCVDPGLVEQMLVNLSVNARDAMPDGGTLVIQSANISVDAAYHASHPEVEPGDYVTIAVTDTGTGMSPDVKARLFEPFFTTKPKGRGTGLGLATTYGAVKQSGGHISVHSQPGRGTTFRIFLPRTAGTGQRNGVDTPACRTPKGHETILVVEDDAEVLGLAARILTSLGYHVITAANGSDALDLASAYLGPHRPAPHRRRHAGPGRATGRRANEGPAPGMPRPLHVGVYRRCHRASRRAG
jgi:PAS domain S-box-containing protein